MRGNISFNKYCQLSGKPCPLCGKIGGNIYVKTKRKKEFMAHKNCIDALTNKVAQE